MGSPCEVCDACWWPAPAVLAWSGCAAVVVVVKSSAVDFKRASFTGGCLLYDTTYEHETKNNHPTQERVVLHVDFFNTLAMTPIEIEVMQYIYNLREEFMKAEGVAKVGAQIL